MEASARHLGSLRDRVRRAARSQHEQMCAAMPAPSDLWSFAGTKKMWQRRTTDPDFGRVRVATAVDQCVSELPVAVPLKAFSRVSVSGPREPVLGLARAMLAHLVTFHHPSTLHVACRAAPGRAPEWEWLTWLPHTIGATLLAGELAARPPHRRPHLVVVLDDRAVSFVDRVPGVTVLDVSGFSAAVTACLELVVDGERLGRRTDAGIMPVGSPDRLSRAQAAFVARRLRSRDPAG